ncbi:MAG TPA: MFS transporter [Caulobacteraceae bacterium]|jgi:MFS family permease
MAAEGVVGRLEARPLAIGAAVVPLLALAVFINYVDRGNLATATPLMKDQLSLSGAQVGLLASAFYWTYTPCQPLAGWLAHRLNPYRTLGLGLALWSLATAATGLVSGFAALIVLRLLLGIGESAAFPCSSKLLAQHLPTARLGAANGLIGVGLALGPAFGTWAGGNLMAVAGWRPAFVIFGLVSALWLVPWLAATRHLDREATATPAAPAPSYVQILARRDAWGAALGHFCSNYGFYFVVSWLPLYLVKAHGLSMGEMASVGGMIYLVYAASCLVCGVLADRWMASGASATLVRKTTVIASHVIPGLAMLIAAAGGPTVAIAALFVAAIGFGMNTSAIFSIGQTLAGPRAAGKWMGVQNGIGNIAGIVGPIITGVVVDRTGSFTWAFVIAGSVALAGVIGWGLMIGKVAPLDWEHRHGHAVDEVG